MFSVSPESCMLSYEFVQIMNRSGFLGTMGAWMGVNRIANCGPYLLLNNELEPYFFND